MAAGGTRCTAGYVSHPFCSPSRAGLLTGRYQQRFGHENNPSFLPHDERVGLPTDQVTIADVLTSVGYVSAMIGKWHLGAAEPFHPLNRGFTHLYGFLGGGHQYFPEKLTVTDPTEHKHQYITKLLRDRVRVDEKEYLTDAFAREAVAFVQENRDRPFFLYLSFNAPHTPMQATPKYLNRFQQISNPTRQTYAAMVSAVDDGVGRLLDTLSELGLDENTLLFFLSDNGGPYLVNGSRNTPLRAGKGSMFEGGIRVPFLVRWSGKIPAGVDYVHPVSALDIFATAAAVADAAVPASHRLDGVNIVPHLCGDVESAPHDVLYWRQGGGSSYAVRRARMKLVDVADPVKLFDLSADLGEQHDLGPDESNTKEQLDQLKQQWNAELVDPLWENPRRKKRR
jgi:arylsulfatase A-like enzyme